MQYSKQPAAQKDDFERALEGLEYPVSHIQIVKAARDHGGIDTEAIRVLEQLPERDYTNEEDVITEIRAIYAAEDTQSPI